MFTVNAGWNTSKGLPISPKMPEQCCYCLKDSATTLEIEEEGIRLKVPYCKEHIGAAKQYYDKYYKSPKRKYIRYASWVLAPVAAIIFIFYAVPGSNLITGEDQLVKIFADTLHFSYTPNEPIDYAAIPFWAKALATAILTFILLHVISYVLDKWLVLHKGAYELGFWKNRYITFVVPGITEVKRNKKDSSASELAYSISFATRNYYLLFKEANKIQ